MQGYKAVAPDDPAPSLSPAKMLMRYAKGINEIPEVLASSFISFCKLIPHIIAFLFALFRLSKSDKLRPFAVQGAIWILIAITILSLCFIRLDVNPGSVL